MSDNNHNQNSESGHGSHTHHSSTHTNQELKNIFNLFNPNSEGEIEIKQINNHIQQLDSLKLAQKQNPAAQASNEADQNEKKGVPSNKTASTVKPAEASKQVCLICLDSSKIMGLTKKIIKPQNGQDNKDYIEVMELRYFPNNKTTLNFNDFCNYFSECVANKEIQEDLLQNCFNQFDFSEDAFINSKKIKQIFEVFNDKTSEEEIQNVLKFCGVSNDKMSYDEFKQFFEKNL